MNSKTAANTTSTAEIATRRSRLAATHPKRSTPGKSATSTPASADAERLFLTPRVIDGKSYDEMSSNLRTLVEQATGLNTQLHAIVERAEATASQLKTSAKRYDERLNLGARLFESICKRAEEVDTVAQKIGTQVNHLEQFEATLQTRHESFCLGLQTEVDHALNNLRLTRGKFEDEADEHYDKVIQQIAKWEEVAEHLNRRLDELPDEIRSSSQPTIDEINNLIATTRRLIGVNENTIEKLTETPTLHQLLQQSEEARTQAIETLRKVNQAADRIKAVRNLLGQETMTAVDAMDQLAHESESLQVTIDAAAALAGALADQTDTGEKRLQEHCNNHIRTIDRQIQDQTGKLKSMKSEVIGITIELDQRKEVIVDLLAEHADEIEAATRTVKYLKHWEKYLATAADENTGEIQIPAELQAALERTRTVVDNEFKRIRNRFADLASAFGKPDGASTGTHHNPQ